MLKLRRDLLLKHVKSRPVFPLAKGDFTQSFSSVYVSPNGFVDGVYLGETCKYCSKTQNTTHAEVEIVSDSEALNAFSRLSKRNTILSFVFVSTYLKTASVIYDAYLDETVLESSSSPSKIPCKLQLTLGYISENLQSIAYLAKET